jgi:hypothetical protein
VFGLEALLAGLGAKALAIGGVILALLLAALGLRQSGKRAARVEAEARDAALKAKAWEKAAEIRTRPGPDPLGGGMRRVEKPLVKPVADSTRGDGPQT